MTFVGIAALIAAVAFAVLIIFTVLLLIDLRKSLKIINKHVDSIGVESNQLLDQANLLASDLNAKSAALDPAVHALGGLGNSVSNIQGAVKRTNDKVKTASGAKTAEKFDVNGIASTILTASVVPIAKQVLKAATAGRNKSKKEK